MTLSAPGLRNSLKTLWVTPTNLVRDCLPDSSLFSFSVEKLGTRSAVLAGYILTNQIFLSVKQRSGFSLLEIIKYQENEKHQKGRNKTQKYQERQISSVSDEVRGVVEPEMIMSIGRSQISSYLGKFIAGVGQSRYWQRGSHPVDTSNSSMLLLVALSTSLVQSQ